MVLSHDEDIVPCNVLEEARKAVGADQKVGWGFSNNDKSATTNSKRSSSGKKELNEKQKAALAKIRGNK